MVSTRTLSAQVPGHDVVTVVMARPRFDAGRVCLNLLATVGRRGAAPVDRLPTPDALAAWLVTAGLLDEPVTAGEADLVSIRKLRQATLAVVQSARGFGRTDARDVAVLNAAAARPTPVPQLDAAGRTATRHSHRPIHAASALLARDAIDLVTGADLARVHECAAVECRMLFLDASRGARRRWCSMSRCGNRAKVRAHAARAARRGR